MLKEKVQLDRDEFVEALVCWMRWRGHAIPHNMLSERFPIANGAAEFQVFKKIAQHLGIQITYKKRNSKLPKPEQFPLIAVMSDYSVRAIRQTVSFLAIQPIR